MPLRTSTCLAALLSLGVSAEATAADLHLSTKVNHPQGLVTLSGSGFAANEQVTISFDAATSATAETNGSGSFSGEKVTVPTTAQPGSHTFSAVGQTSGDAAQASFAVSTNWGQAGFDAANTSFNPYENTLSVSNIASLTQKYSVLDNGEDATSPAVFGCGRIYFGNFYIPPKGQAYYGLSKIDAATGRFIWTSTDSGPVGTTPALESNVVYVTSADGQVCAVGATTGALHWKTTPGSATDRLTSPVFAKGNLYVGSNDGNLYAFAAASGSLLWKFTIGSQNVLTPTVVNNVVYVSGDSVNNQANVVYAIDAQTGTSVWSYTPSARPAQSPTFIQGLLIFELYNTTPSINVIALHAKDGSPIWGVNDPNSPAGIAAANGTVYVENSSALYALSAATGAPLWSTAVSNTPNGAPAVANGVVYLATYDSSGAPYLNAFNAATGAEIWSASTGQSGGSFGPSPIVANGTVYVSNQIGPFTAFSLPPQAKAPTARAR